jgi:hypothetical protein
LSPVVQAAAALAAGMGVGRFVNTPILPLMHAQAGLLAGAGANLATANFVGYLAGALAGIFPPRLVRSSAVLRRSLLALIATLADTRRFAASVDLRDPPHADQRAGPGSGHQLLQIADLPQVSSP